MTLLIAMSDSIGYVNNLMIVALLNYLMIGTMEYVILWQKTKKNR